MNALDQLKGICVKKTFKSFKDLVPGEYIVDSFALVSTTYGNRVRVTIDNGSTFLYLPERFVMTESTVAELNETPKIMIYGGKEGNSVKGRLILDFKDVDYLANAFFDYGK